MSPPKRPNTTDEGPAGGRGRSGARSVMQLPGLPIRGRLLKSNLSPWLLALCIAVALILRATSAAEAQESWQDWLPEALELPEDIEIVANRQIGSTIRMLKFRTSADAEDLLVLWEDALRSSGYAIGRGRDEPLDGLIEFSGSEIVNAKIIAATRGEDRRSVIEIDATLR